MSARLRRDKHVTALWIAMAAYVVVLGSLVLLRHARLGSAIFSLGIFDQAVWLIAHGHTPWLTTRGMNAFADHFDPILYLIAPLYWLYDSPRTLLVLQTCVLALGALPVYHIARKRLLTDGWALLLSLAYLLYSPLQWINLYDFHPDSFAPTLILSALWFLDTRRFRSVLLMLVLLLMCKETMGFTVIAIACYAWIKIDRRIAVAAAALGLAGLIVSMTTIRVLNHGSPSQYLSFYAPYGNSLPAIVGYICAHPIQILNELVSHENTVYVAGLMLPLMFLPMAAPEYLLMALPALLANMLASRPALHSGTSQHHAVIVPIVFLATIEGLRHLRLILPTAGRKGSWLRALLPVLLLAGIAHSVASGPLGPNPTGIHIAPLFDSQAQAALSALNVIPPGASVCAQNPIGAHLAHRMRLYTLPNPFQTASWGNSPTALAQQEGREFAPLPAEELRRRIADSDVEYVVLGPSNSSTIPIFRSEDFAYFARLLLTDVHYAAVAAKGDVVVLKRGADSAIGRALLDHAVSSGECQILKFVGLDGSAPTSR